MISPKGKSFYLIILTFLFHSCSLVEADAPPGKWTGKQVFRNNKTAVEAVTKAYEDISAKPNFLASGASVYAGLYCGEVVYNGQTDQIREFWNGQVSTNNSTLETFFWNNSYAIINHLNLCIQGLSENNLPDTSLRKQLMGECKVLRATMYFYMSQFFGDVPLVTTPDYTVNETLPRAALSKVKSLIIADLQEAKSLLTEEYPGTGRARANRYSAAALLARIYLYDNNYTMAIQESDEIINSGLYKLEALDNVFVKDSREAILQIQPMIKYTNTMDGLTFVPKAEARPMFSIDPDLLSRFQSADNRKSKWIGTTLINGTTYTYPFKYKKRADQPTAFKLTECTAIYRLAEIYLIRAESYAATGSLQNAISDVDMVRQRAGLSLIATTNPGISASKLTDLIRNEQRLEFFAELGHRFLNLKRTGELNELLTHIKNNWKKERILWPIPEDQIALNRNLVQNPGYK